MSQTLELILRLLLAGALGALIGFEREIRAKEAGVRTHFLVALASALFMLVSQYGFSGAERFDAARVAAQVVSGIGFLGAGIIIFQRNSVRGLTTAAGLWVTSAIGLAAAAGLYVLAAVTTALVLICLETMHFVSLRGGHKILNVTLSASDEQLLTQGLREVEGRTEKTVYSRSDGRCSLTFLLHVGPKEKIADVIDRLNAIEGVRLDNLE